MTRSLTLTLIGEAAFFSALLSFLARPNTTAQILLLPLGLLVFVLWLITLAKVFTERILQRRVCAIAVFLSVPLLFAVVVASGRPLRNFLFQMDLPKMQAVVNQLKAGSLQPSRRSVALPAQYRSIAYQVRAVKSPVGVWTVEFWVGGGFPAKHFIYLYKSDDTVTAKERQNWPSGYHLTPCWFECSD
ncbi:hypothetical protein IAD21_00489 [Abditibacteriota bacterium]|nr:hypothetical protein IAD21_00489 [Abditibacteriota bacterium]